MKMNFYKYQGTGNDFVMIDNRQNKIDKSDLKLVAKLCDRKFGIGADGLILIENHPEVDFDMIYFNADGTKSFCGNGSRCAIAFANYLGIIENKTTFNAIDGIHEATINGELIELKMGDVSNVEQGQDYFFIETGSPHYIQYTASVQEIDIVPTAHKVRYNERFKEKGTNVNFVQKVGETLEMRTYERGVEDETLSCGTGATAVAISGAIKHGLTSPVAIKVQGGDLQIKFNQISDNEFDNIWLIGKGEQVYSGEMTV
ncbi:diaminopimelate epimerase [Flavobacteriales bacterium]|nr:diaminopimelate epimerase [Flavobacteriales bacterium]MDA9775874.1 diaminopimelate epimerase [Flavobacteriales bacterium]MDC0015414.1 diaminopimelate epimerase [Flavobacteriales bacterium]MDC1370661.1 diaminopimelate epimerase [Flavobacteriales bacterium]